MTALTFLLACVGALTLSSLLIAYLTGDLERIWKEWDKE